MTGSWIDWRRMHPLVDARALDSVDRAQIAAQQQPPTANRPVRES